MIGLTVERQAAVPRVCMVLAGRISGDQVAQAFIRLYAEEPDAVRLDRLFDFTAYEGGFEVEHLQQIARAYRALNPDPAHPCRTAFVTRDPHFPLWARSMGFQFEGRNFRAFATQEEAERFLDEPLEQRRSA